MDKFKLSWMTINSRRLVMKFYDQCLFIFMVDSFQVSSGSLIDETKEFDERFHSFFISKYLFLIVFSWSLQIKTSIRTIRTWTSDRTCLSESNVIQTSNRYRTTFTIGSSKYICHLIHRDDHWKFVLTNRNERCVLIVISKNFTIVI